MLKSTDKMKNKLKQFAKNETSQFGEDGIIKKKYLKFCLEMIIIGVLSLGLGMVSF